MQFSKFALIAALAAPAFAQTADLSLLAELPACALGPATTAIGSTSCGATDIKCACSDSAFITGLTATVQKACSAADIAKTLEVATKLCASAGVSLTVPGAGSSAPVASSSAAVSIESSAPVYGAPTTTAPSSATASVTIVPTTNGTLTTPTITHAPSASFTGAANAVRGSFAAGILGAVGAVLFL